MPPKEAAKKPLASDAAKKPVANKSPAPSLPKATPKPSTKPPAAAPSSSPQKTLKKPDAKSKDKATPKEKAANAAATLAVQPQVDEAEVARLKQEALLKAQAEMEELRKNAWMAQVEFDRKQEVKRQKKAEEEAKRRKEEAALTKALLEAAFDGEDDELLKLLDKGAALHKDMVDCCDGHGNTLLSEAATGGSVSTIKLLLARSANPNSQGEFKRTPMWRAAFLGHTEAIAPLLEGGADPRIANESGELPLHVASVPAIKQVLQEWDVTLTDALVAKWQAAQEHKIAAAAAELAVAIRGAEDEAEAAKQGFDQAQQALRHARMELEKRIFEHDTCVEEKKPDELIKVTLEQVHLAEAAVEAAKKTSIAASERLDTARFALRERQAAEREACGDEGLPGLAVDIQELDDVLLRDVGDKMKADGSLRWPLVIDTSGQASVFLRYQDTNYVNALSPLNMEPDRLRRSILGGIRYGKPVVLDLMDVDLWPELPRLLDAVHPGLLQALLTRSLLKDDGFKVLIRKKDGDEYDINKFQATRVSAFKLIFLTSLREPNEDLVQQTYAMRVRVKG